MKSPFTSTDFTSRSWNDILFEHRNKAYGAYNIRTQYNYTLAKALSICILFTAAVFGSVFLYTSFKGSIAIASEKPYNDDVVIDPREPNFKIEPQKVMPAGPAIQTAGKDLGKIVPDYTPQKKQPDVDNSGTTSTSTTGITSGNNDGVGATGTGTSTTVSPVGAGSSPVLAPDTVMRWVEIMPEFPGGEEAMNKYLTRNIQPTKQWLEFGDDGQIYYQFIVGRDGKVRDVIVKSDRVEYGCAEFNSKVLKNMPAWKPGSQNGHEVSVIMILPVTFKKR